MLEPKATYKVNLGFKYFGTLVGLILLDKFFPHFLFAIGKWVVAIPLLVVAALLGVLAFLLVILGVLQLLIFILEILCVLKHGKYRVFKSKFLNIRK